MNRVRERLASGRRWWAAEIVVRGLGLAALAGAALVAIHVRRLAIPPAGRGGDVIAFAACAGVVVLLFCGLALTLEGPGLFRRRPRPPRALLP